uniref:Plasmid recombination enzyme n=1 Tax=uncultured prokaryote TaxID=198431 RepID=A0A0H5Q233_9ZZZZ|nr:hypothetical protein [uncultured prokaryote]
MGYAIMRLAPRSMQGAQAMLAHALRETVPANAIEGAPRPEPLAGVATSAQGMAKVRAAVQACKEAKRWQKSIKPVLDVLVTFSRDDLARLTKEQQDDYFARSLAFATERFGGPENVLTAVVHRDEATPHMQLLVLARYDDVRLSASKFMGGKGQLHQLQNDFWKACGKPFGMQRGEPRTGAKNLPVRQLYGALAAGAEPPELLEVPEVSLKDRLVAPERIAQRQRAIEQNNQTIEQLRAQAARGRGLHPELLAREAERYRAAVRRADLAEQQAQEAAKRASEALKAAEQGERYLADLDRRLEARQRDLAKVDADIDRLREMRDRERGLDR